MRYSVDRIEDGIATLVDEHARAANVAVTELPKGVREGDTLDGEIGRYRLVDREETARKRQDLQDRLHRLVRKNQQ